MLHPKDIGDRSLLAVMLALQAQGFALSVPFGENTRYDLILDNGAALRRVQCKTGRYRNGAVIFPTCSSYAHHPNPKPVRTDYVGQIDDFAVYCPEIGAVYLVPIDDISARKRATLRVTETRNGQRARVRLARPYEIARFSID